MEKVKVKLLSEIIVKGKRVPPGSTVEVPIRTANRLILTKKAEKSKAPQKPPAPKPE